MRRDTLNWTLPGVLVVLAALGLSGCGSNEAQVASSDQTEQNASDRPETTADVANEFLERERGLIERETRLADRETELDGLEARLSERLELIDARALELDTRVAELAEREAALDRREVGDLAVPFEPEPTAHPVPVARSVVVTLPSATAFEIEFDETLSSETSVEGDSFHATVARDVLGEGLVAVPAGSRVWGTVASVVPGKNIGGQAALSLRFDAIDVPSGESIPVEAFLEFEGRRQTKKDAATIGGSAAGGAILGRVLSDKKGKGTAIGAILGAAVGAAVASENGGDPVVIEPGTTAEVFLEAPVIVALAVGPEDIVANRP